MSHETLLAFAKRKDLVADRPYSLALKVDSPSSNTLEFETYWLPGFTYGFTEGAVTFSPTLTSTNAPIGLRNYRINVPAGTTAIYFKLATPTNFLESSFRVNQGTNAQTVREVEYWKTLPTARFSMVGHSHFVKVPDKLFSNCRNMTLMFFNCTAFNQPLDWDTSLVTSMDSTFYGCSSFNQPLNWNTANVTSMASMFTSCNKFSQPLNFNTSNVTTMGRMFQGCVVFNQPVTFSDTSKVTSMNYMFQSCHAFNQPVQFNTVNVRTMQAMFQNCALFNQLVNFDTANVTTMASMFSGCGVFNQPVNFDTSNVTLLISMFQACRALNKPVTFSDVSKVTSLDNLFNTCTAFNQDMSTTIFKSTASRTSYSTGASLWLSTNKPKFTA